MYCISRSSWFFNDCKSDFHPAYRCDGGPSGHADRDFRAIDMGRGSLPDFDGRSHPLASGYDRHLVPTFFKLKKQTVRKADRLRERRSLVVRSMARDNRGTRHVPLGGGGPNAKIAPEISKGDVHRHRLRLMNVRAW